LDKMICSKLIHMKCLKKFLLPIILGLIVACTNPLNQPTAELDSNIEMHRFQDSTLDESGWYYAASTNGNFSLYMPIPFNDYTQTVDDYQTYGIASTSFEGISFTVLQSKNLKPGPIDLKALVSKLGTPAQPVSDVKYYSYDNYEAVNFKQKSFKSAAYMKYAVYGPNLYMMIIEFPYGQEELVVSMKDGFFDFLEIEDSINNATTIPELMLE
jgi:hypothetical protein